MPRGGTSYVSSCLGGKWGRVASKIGLEIAKAQQCAATAAAPVLQKEMYTVIVFSMNQATFQVC